MAELHYNPSPELEDAILYNQGFLVGGVRGERGALLLSLTFRREGEPPFVTQMGVETAEDFIDQLQAAVADLKRMLEEESNG